MTTAEILLFIALTWIVTASVIVLVFCLRLKRDNERAQLQCKFDPMDTRGIERGDQELLREILRGKRPPAIKPPLDSI